MGKTYLIQPVSTTDWRFGAKSVGGGKSGVEGYGGKGYRLKGSKLVSRQWEVASGENARDWRDKRERRDR